MGERLIDDATADMIRREWPGDAGGEEIVILMARAQDFIERHKPYLKFMYEVDGVTPMNDESNAFLIEVWNGVRLSWESVDTVTRYLSWIRHHSMSEARALLRRELLVAINLEKGRMN